MKDIELAFYENYCKRCESEPRCPWRCISGDTCLELTSFKEKPSQTTERDIEIEFNKLFYNELRSDCWTYNCESRDCCECHIYQSALEEYKNERQKD